MGAVLLLRGRNPDRGLALARVTDRPRRQPGSALLSGGLAMAAVPDQRPRTLTVRLAALLCETAAAFAAAAFLIIAARVVLALVSRDLAFVQLALPAAAALVLAVAMACIGQALRLIARVADDVWWIKQDLMTQAEGPFPKPARRHEPDGAVAADAAPGEGRQ